MDNKALTDRAQKASLYGWFGGSLCTIVLELYELAGGAFSCYNILFFGRPHVASHAAAGRGCRLRPAAQQLPGPTRPARVGVC